MKAYEHLMWDVSPAALEWIGAAVAVRFGVGDAVSNPEIRAEIQNFINECRGRLQHVTAGEPDISQGAAPTDGWLA